MSFQTAGDALLQVVSENSSSERRITPAWTIGQLKAKLEPVTGIPPLSQKITLRGVGGDVAIEALDEENTQLVHFPLAPYAELHVSYASVSLCMIVVLSPSMIPPAPRHLPPLYACETFPRGISKHHSCF